MVQSRRHRGNHVASEIVADPELTQSDAHRLVKRPVGKFRNTDADHIVFGDGSIENKPAQHGPRYDDHGGSGVDQKLQGHGSVDLSGYRIDAAAFPERDLGRPCGRR